MVQPGNPLSSTELGEIAAAQPPRDDCSRSPACTRRVVVSRILSVDADNARQLIQRTISAHWDAVSSLRAWSTHDAGAAGARSAADRHDGDCTEPAAMTGPPITSKTSRPSTCRAPAKSLSGPTARTRHQRNSRFGVLVDRSIGPVNDCSTRNLVPRVDRPDLTIPVDSRSLSVNKR